MNASFWLNNPPRIGWTQFCADQMHVPIPVEDVTEREAQIIQRRADLLATVMGLQQATSNREIRSAQVGSRN